MSSIKMEEIIKIEEISWLDGSVEGEGLVRKKGKKKWLY